MAIGNNFCSLAPICAPVNDGVRARALSSDMSVLNDAGFDLRSSPHIAIITQTIPKLDEIYSREERLLIQGGAGLKLYMTPSEEMTIEVLSKACGMTTKRTVSVRTEEKPLLPEDEARRLPRDAVIIIVNGEQSVKAKRVVRYKAPTFTRILKAQEAMGWDSIDRNLANARMTRID